MAERRNPNKEGFGPDADEFPPPGERGFQGPHARSPQRAHEGSPGAYGRGPEHYWAHQQTPYAREPLPYGPAAEAHQHVPAMEERDWQPGGPGTQGPGGPPPHGAEQRHARPPYRHGDHYRHGEERPQVTSPGHVSAGWWPGPGPEGSRQQVPGAYRSDEDLERRVARGFGKEPNFSGRGPKGYKRSNERIHEDVCDRLLDDAYVDASDIEVRVEDGEVVLEGHVTDRHTKHRAENLAAGITGVSDVQNRLRVQPDAE